MGARGLGVGSGQTGAVHEVKAPSAQRCSKCGAFFHHQTKYQIFCLNGHSLSLPQLSVREVIENDEINETPSSLTLSINSPTYKGKNPLKIQNRPCDYCTESLASDGPRSSNTKYHYRCAEELNRSRANERNLRVAAETKERNRSASLIRHCVRGTRSNGSH